VLLLVLLAVVPLAYGNPPDPSWIGGIYDDADYDDVVVAVGSAMGTVEDIRPVAVPIALLVFVLVVSDARFLPAAPRLPSVSRAPPA
jgi:hypothetical protein